MKKKLISLIVATLTIASLAACGSTDTASEKSPVTSESAAKDEAQADVDAADVETEAAEESAEVDLSNLAFTPENFEIAKAFVEKYNLEVPAEFYDNVLAEDKECNFKYNFVDTSYEDAPLTREELHEMFTEAGAVADADVVNEIGTATLNIPFEELCEQIGCEPILVGVRVRSDYNQSLLIYGFEATESDGTIFFWYTFVDGRENIASGLQMGDYLKLAE